MSRGRLGPENRRLPGTHTPPRSPASADTPVCARHSSTGPTTRHRTRWTRASRGREPDAAVRAYAFAAAKRFASSLSHSGVCSRCPVGELSRQTTYWCVDRPRSAGSTPLGTTSRTGGPGILRETRALEHAAPAVGGRRNRVPRAPRLRGPAGCVLPDAGEAARHVSSGPGMR